MPKAVFNGVVLAESDNVQRVEGNVYFPPESLQKQLFSGSDTHTVCSWKGTCSYYDLNVSDKKVTDAAWYYPDPKTAAKNITGYVAFYTSKGIKIEN